MSPKKAAGKAKGKSAASAGSDDSYLGKCEANSSMVLAHSNSITTDLQLILDQDGLAELIRDDAGGSPAQAPFNAEAFGAAMEQGGVYRCGGNALWASIATGPVAPNAQKLEDIRNAQFSQPSPVFPETIIVAIVPDGPDPRTPAKRGSLLRISPEEPVHAWIIAAATSIQNGEGPEVLADWIRMIKAAPMEFRKMDDPKKVFWAQVGEREAIGRRYATMFRTASGRILEIVAFADMESKRLKKEMSRHDIAKAWEANFKSSNMSETVNFAMVDAAMKCYNGIYKVQAAAKLVLETEDSRLYPAGSHWSVYKLVEACRKATVANVVSEERVVDLLAGVNYRVRSRSVEPGEITVKGLCGKGQIGNKGLLDLLLYQWQLRAHLLNDTLAALTVTGESKSKLRQAMSSYSSFHEECMGDKGIAWIGVLEKPAQLLQKLIQGACFLTDHDPTLKRFLRTQLSIPELLQEQPFKQLMSEVMDAVAVTAAGSAAASQRVSQSAKADEKWEEEDQGNDEAKEHAIALQSNLGSNAPAEVAQTAFNALKKSQKAKVHEFEQEAMRLVRIGCELLVERPTAQEMAADIRATERARLRGSPIDGYCLFIYNPRSSGESKTQPRTRPPPLRTSPAGPGGNHVRKMITAALASRVPPGEDWDMDLGDLFVVCDGGRHSGPRYVPQPIIPPQHHQPTHPNHTPIAHPPLTPTPPAFTCHPAYPPNFSGMGTTLRSCLSSLTATPSPSRRRRAASSLWLRKRPWPRKRKFAGAS